MSAHVTPLPAPPDQPKFFWAECELAPGKRGSVKLPSEALTKFGFVKLKRKDGGLFPVLKTWQGVVRLTDDLPEKLGIGMDSQTLRTLCYAGFVKSSRPTPFVTLIDIQSLLDHIEATTGEGAGEFWTEANRRRYARAYWASGQRLKRVESKDQPDLFTEGLATETTK